MTDLLDDSPREEEHDDLWQAVGHNRQTEQQLGRLAHLLQMDEEERLDESRVHAEDNDDEQQEGDFRSPQQRRHVLKGRARAPDAV